MVCGGVSCPLTDLSRVEPALASIDTACYTAPGEEVAKERLETRDEIILYNPSAMTVGKRG